MIRVVVAAIGGLCFASQAPAQSFNHPGIAHSRAELEFVRAKVKLRTLCMEHGGG
jgi:hypothetical protein